MKMATPYENHCIEAWELDLQLVFGEFVVLCFLLGDGGTHTIGDYACGRS
ncbi:hypothetical protein A2U01_0012253 [Trifolium medium]|uniref:Uncharacterized protein n=1 Tax=Trifolium medium TaxID=97028 RepID=A0A392MUV8_9FABA|nr:hypothetical protein [Trifolium medium]